MTKYESGRAFREARKALGRCPLCGEKQDDDRVTCRACRRRGAMQTTNRRALRAAVGLCSTCGKVNTRGTKYLTCAACRERARGYKKKFMEGRT